jgi:succinate dehydrogenase / fumarate reductase iron-sulfur subunit
MEQQKRTITLRIKRFNPEQDRIPNWQEYKIEVNPTDRIIDGLHQVKWFQDGTLSFRRSCVHGICGSDDIRIDGRNRLACKVLFQNLGDVVTIEPIAGLPVLKDLIVDMEPFMENYRTILPFFINEDPTPAAERYQSREDRARFDDSTKCILCACCTTSCPSFWANGDYIGPQAIVQAHRFIFDSRDQGSTQRLDILADPDGVWRCRTIFNCTDACPREIKVTKAISEVKREMLFRQM